MKKPVKNESPELSKSQLKREAREMFDLGRRLTDLPPSQLGAIPLDGDILEAIEFARSIKARVARKRQLGYLAKLLRLADTAAIEEALENLQGSAREVNARHHRTERWRDALLLEGDAALGRLLAQRQDVDPQSIRILMRNAAREASRDKPPAAARKLFKLLRELDEAQPLPPLPV